MGLAVAWLVWHCAACGQVLGEYSGDGFTLRLRCKHSRRDGQPGRCGAWNTLTVPRHVPVR